MITLLMVPTSTELRGGDGPDTFRFLAGDGKTDRLLDFELGTDLIDLSGWSISRFDGLTISEFVPSSGIPAGYLIVDFDVESLRIDGFDAADIASFSAANFLFDDGIVNGTSSGETIDGSYSDADGTTITDYGQTIRALGGNDLIYDGAGDDIVKGGGGRDEFYAGGGSDTYCWEYPKLCV